MHGALLGCVSQKVPNASPIPVLLTRAPREGLAPGAARRCRASAVRDERWAMIDLHATALAGLVTITLVIGGFLYEIANGEDGSPYVQIGAVAGLSYIVAVALLRRRS